MPERFTVLSSGQPALIVTEPAHRLRKRMCGSPPSAAWAGAPSIGEAGTRTYVPRGISEGAAIAQPSLAFAIGAIAIAQPNDAITYAHARRRQRKRSRKRTASSQSITATD